MMNAAEPTRSKAILLVEDDEDNRAIYSTVLRYGGYRVMEACDGVLAMKLLRSWLPQLVLLDITIPRLDGWYVASWMKKRPRTSAIPIVGLTGHAGPECHERAGRIGFAAYLVKPVEPKAVLRCVRGIVGAPEVQRELRWAL